MKRLQDVRRNLLEGTMSRMREDLLDIAFNELQRAADAAEIKLSRKYSDLTTDEIVLIVIDALDDLKHELKIGR